MNGITARELAAILNRMDPDTEVMIPYPTPREHGERLTGPALRDMFQRETIDGRTVLVIGNTSRGTVTDVNARRLVREAVLEELQEIADSLDLGEVTHRDAPLDARERANREILMQIRLRNGMLAQAGTTLILITASETATQDDVRKAWT